MPHPNLELLKLTAESCGHCSRRSYSWAAVQLACWSLIRELRRSAPHTMWTSSPRSAPTLTMRNILRAASHARLSRRHTRRRRSAVGPVDR